MSGWLVRVMVSQSVNCDAKDTSHRVSFGVNRHKSFLVECVPIYCNIFFFLIKFIYTPKDKTLLSIYFPYISLFSRDRLFLLNKIAQ